MLFAVFVLPLEHLNAFIWHLYHKLLAVSFQHLKIYAVLVCVQQIGHLAHKLPRIRICVFAAGLCFTLDFCHHLHGLVFQLIRNLCGLRAVFHAQAQPALKSHVNAACIKFNAPNHCSQPFYMYRSNTQPRCLPPCSFELQTAIPFSRTLHIHLRRPHFQRYKLCVLF